MAADSKGKLDEHRLGLLLNNCIQIPKHLGEIAAFGGSNVDSSIKSCFEKVYTISNTIMVSQNLVIIYTTTNL